MGRLIPYCLRARVIPQGNSKGDMINGIVSPNNRGKRIGQILGLDGWSVPAGIASGDRIESKFAHNEQTMYMAAKSGTQATSSSSRIGIVNCRAISTTVA